MAYRLIFTSSARALVGSRTGFCTVARSRDMSEKLAAIVEKCGTYDHDMMQAYPIFSHRKIMFANCAYHVLSRIADAGADYTKRSNYIADHLVLSCDEARLLPSPAQAILDKTDWFKSWSDEPKWLGNETIEKRVQRFAPPAKNWQEIFKDAGKATTLIDSCTPIFAQPQDGEILLKLFAESTALRNDHAKAWDYTFTTAICRGENPSDFSWKVEVSPSKERMSAEIGAINLRDKTAPETPESPLANYARSAKISNRDRLGLKVASAAEFKPRIHVASAQSQMQNSGKTKIIAISAVAVLIVLALIIFTFAGTKKGDDSFDFANAYTAPKGSPNAIDYSSAVTSSQTYSSVRASIKDSIAQNDWNKAIELWQKSKLDEYNPRAMNEILSDIGARADSLMTEADKILSNPNPTSDDEPKAVAMIAAARNALELQNMPNYDERLERWRKIEKKVKKL